MGLHPQEVSERLKLAKEAGELERQDLAVDQSILDLSGDLEAARAERDRIIREEIAQGIADIRKQFAQYQEIEAGKQQAREAFERFQAEQQLQRAQEVERPAPREYELDGPEL